MSFTLNTQFNNNPLAFLQNHAVAAVHFNMVQYRPPAQGAGYDFLRSDLNGDTGVFLMYAANNPTDAIINGYWLPQGEYIDVDPANPLAPNIFTPELSGCKIYVDVLPSGLYRVFHIQCPHEAVEYAVGVRGVRRAQIDSDDYGAAPGPGALPAFIPAIRAFVMLRHDGNQWHFFLQGLTGIGPGIGNGRVQRVAGPQQVQGVATKAVP